MKVAHGPPAAGGVTQLMHVSDYVEVGGADTLGGFLRTGQMAAAGVAGYGLMTNKRSLTRTGAIWLIGLTIAKKLLG